MASLDILSLFFGVIDILKLGFMLAIPLFLLTLAGKRIQQWGTETFSLSWIQSAFLAVYSIAFLLIFVLYFGIYFLALQEFTVGIIPPDIEIIYHATTLDLLLIAVVSLVKRAFIAVALTFLIIPFTFIASLAKSTVLRHFKIKRKKYTPLQEGIALFASVFIASSLAVFIMLLWSFILPGLITLIFFA